MAEEHKHPVPDQPAAEAPDAQPAFDEASASLSDALRTSFRVFTFLILLLIALFIAQGFFTVQSDQKAIILRFGAYQQGRVKDPGVHYAFPYPIDRVVPIWVKTRKLAVNTFWKRTTEQEKDTQMEKGTPAPTTVPGAEDAYMLTGDLNILQAQWDVTYRIKQNDEAVVDYYKQIGEGLTGDLNEMRLVKTALQSAVIHEVSGMKVFDIYPSGKEVLVEHVKTTLDKTLSKLNCGLEVDRVTLRELRPPEEVKAAFDNVLAATQAMADLRLSATRDREKTLIETAGEVGVPLGDDLERWWAAKDAGDAQAMQTVEADMSKNFQSAGGQVRGLIADAEAYRVEVVQSAKGDRSTMESLLKNPGEIKVFLDHARVDALQEVLNNCYEKYFYNVASDKSHRLLTLWLSRRPELIRAQTKPLEYR